MTRQAGRAVRDLAIPWVTDREALLAHDVQATSTVNGTVTTSPSARRNCAQSR